MDNTGYCCVDGPASDTIEGKERRKKGARFLRMLSLTQIALSTLSIVIGLVSIGVALTNPNYPKINGYALLNGIMILIGGVYGMKATQPEVVSEAGRTVRNYITVHYTLCITCLSISVLQTVFTGWAVSECFSQDLETVAKCQPYMTTNIVLGVLVIMLAVALFVTCVTGSVFFCSYQRVFGFQDQNDRIQQELTFQPELKTGKQAYENYFNDGHHGW